MKKYFSKILFVLWGVLLLGTFAANDTFAVQEAKQAEENTVEQNNDTTDFGAITAEIDTIQQALLNNNSPEALDGYVSYLNKTDSALSENRKVLEKQVKFIQKQLDALGSGPKEGESEDEVITKQREELAQQLAAQDRLLKETDLLVIKMEELAGQILNVRNQTIYGDLMTKQSAMINPLVFFQDLKAYVIFFWDIVKSPIEWYNSIPQEQRSYTLFSIGVMFVILMIALTLAIFFKRFILRNWGYNAENKTPSFNRKVIAAMAVAVARGLIFAFLVGGCILWMVSTNIFGDTLLNTVLMVAAYTCLLAIAEATVSRVTFAPNYPNWRLVNIATEKATRFTRMIFTFIIINSIAAFQVVVAQKKEYSTETVHFVMMFSSFVKAFFLIWLAKISFDTYRDEIKEDTNDNTTEEEEIAINSGFRMILFSHIFCVGTFALSLFGYPELSLFIFNHLIISLILCGLLEIVRRSVIDIIKRIVIGGPWMRKYKGSKRLAEKMDFWLKAIINPTIILVGLFMLLNLWGLPGDFMLSAVKKLLFGFKIGGIQISLIAIVLGIGVFFGSLTLMRIIKKHLAENVLPKIDMDDGIKHSMISGVSFIGFIISALLAIIAVGIDLTNLAFIAGALSVGIGFGLQDVIKNLVAGIIILFERPVKVGDWVVLGGVEGTIKQINIRSTELLSFDKMSVIIPNATLISSTVTNKTHGDFMSRQSVSVGVAYGSDVEKVKNILLSCAAENKLVMKNPAPYVLFKDFGSSSLDFELRCYVKDIRSGWTVPSELRYMINRRFIEEGIEIPFPQMVVHRGDKVSQDSQFYAKHNEN
ncbi:MAG: mechanosensitive ion channel family protein [Alphaproteobacteria bacterium]|nr:mechanosensitive ion channel family protein [Alphaproteobacteria bacterium]